jgi:predicted metal-binding membrane protein
MASVAQRETPWRVSRTQLGLLALLLAAAALAWVLTRERMLGMDAGPGTDPGGLGFYVVSWVVMMAAMMFPSISPMVLTFAFIQRRRAERGALDRQVSQWTFIAGYLIAWTAAGLVAYGLVVAVRSLSIPAFSWHRGGRYLASGVLFAAAAYQLTPAKDACLRRCRGTLGFLMEQWREGPWGALRMGVVHGAWCVGCCWGLMAALFALGLMSLTWMIVVAALIAIEKLLPSKALANRLVAITLVALGLGVAITPDNVPALTIPGSPSATRAMHRMGMGGGAMKHTMTTSTGSMNHTTAMPMGRMNHTTAMPTGSMHAKKSTTPTVRSTGTRGMAPGMPTGARAVPQPSPRAP